MSPHDGSLSLFEFRYLFDYILSGYTEHDETHSYTGLW